MPKPKQAEFPVIEHKDDPVVEDSYTYMVNDILPGIVTRFLDKAADYGSTFEELGIKGQYSDIHRKVRKLKRAMWEGEELSGEQIDEILADLVGNCLISTYLYMNEDG